MGTLDEDITEQERLTAAIGKILSKHDPAALGPGQWSEIDEYQSEARDIANWIRQQANPARGDPLLLIDGVRQILEQSLGVDCHRVEEIAADIQNLLLPEIQDG